MGSWAGYAPISATAAAGGLRLIGAVERARGHSPWAKASARLPQPGDVA